VQSMRQVRSASVAQPRFMMLLLAASAAIAFTIGAVGLYSLISYSVARRRKEFGVRMALGARPGDVIRLVVREGVTIAAWGIAIGVPLALAFSRLLERFLFSVRPSDPLLVGLVALLLAGVAVAAAYFPARRASRTDSLTALREE
jgi:putative ABC transport system permease protein